MGTLKSYIKIKDRTIDFLNNIFYYKICLISFCLINTVRCIYYINRVLLVISSLWGLYLLINACFIKKYFWKFKHWLSIIFLFMAYLIVFLYMDKQNWIIELLTMLFCFIYLILLFIPTEQELKNNINEIYILSNITMIFTFVTSLISWFMFLNSYQAQIIVNEKLVSLGITFRSNNIQLTGLASSPIGMGTTAVISIISSVIILFIQKQYKPLKSKKTYLFNLVNIILQLLVLFAADSFTPLIFLIGFLVSMAFFYTYRCIDSKLQIFIVKCAVSFLSSILAIVVIIVLRRSVSCVYTNYFNSRNLPAQNDEIIQDSEDKTELLNEDVSIIDSGRSITTNFSSGRIDIWINALSQFYNNKFLGVGNTNINIPYRGDITFNNPHNGFLGILLAIGFPALVIIITIIIVLIKMIIFLLKQTQCKYYNLVLLLFSFSVGILFYNLGMNDLLMSRSIIAFLFWSSMGYMLSTIEIWEQENCITEPNEKKALYYADSPYMFMSTMNIAFNSSYEYNVLITNGSSNYEEVNFSMFDEVWVDNQKTFRRRIISLVEMLFFPLRSVTKRIPNYNKQILFTDIYCCDTNSTLIALYNYCVSNNPLIRLHMIEDGLKNYVTPTDLHPKMQVIKKAMNLFGKDFLLDNFNDGIFFRPQLAQKYLDIPLKQQIPVLKNKNLFHEAFNNYLIPINYPEKSIIYFEQYTETESKVYNSIEKDVLAVITNSKKNRVILKRHPSKNLDFDYKKFNVELFPSIVWEPLFIEEDIFWDNFILISRTSTAAFSPKFIFDREPYIIFTDYLYSDFYEGDGKISCKYNLDGSFQYAIGELEKMYRTPNKIFRVRSLNELDEVLDVLTNHKGTSINEKQQQNIQNSQ